MSSYEFYYISKNKNTLTKGGKMHEKIFLSSLIMRMAAACNYTAVSELKQKVIMVCENKDLFPPSEPCNLL